MFAYLLVPILIIGFAGIVVYHNAPLDNADDVLLKLVIETASFSPWVIGLMLSGALAAAMSTGSNLAHTAAMVTARDLVGIIRPGMNDAQMVRLTKVIVVVISAAAYILALLNLSSLVTLLLGAYGVIAQLFPLTMAVLFWPRATRAGAYAGLCIGSAVYLLFTFGLASPFDFNPGVWGLIANGLALVGVSLVTRPMESAHVRRFIDDAGATAGSERKQTALHSA